ncbi:hypothetical protein Q31b_40150 [Novipirellula aureliae]|uniref:Uncharacterized protein n=1 Tax=Novipirellula aureliae TaxID=2527966 RepID=A0A5C6DSM7_9BACT|nr:hypothetical protein Q31b_40150 [Novipirellula aureliae]
MQHVCCSKATTRVKRRERKTERESLWRPEKDNRKGPSPPVTAEGRDQSTDLLARVMVRTSRGFFSFLFF